MTEIVDKQAYTIDLKYRSDATPEAETDRNRETVLAAIDRLVDGDKEPFWAMFDEDVTFHEAQCLPYGGSHRGKTATREAHGTVYEYFDKIHIELEQILAAGDLVIAYAQMSYRVRKNGRTGRFPLAELYRFRDGKVIEWRVHYFDASTVAEALNAD